MKRRKRYRLFLALAACFSIQPSVWADYVDYRGHNVDSIEMALTMRPLNPETPQDSADYLRAYSELMLGYLNTDRARSIHYARRAINLARKTGTLVTQADAYKTIGQHYWASEMYDSASYCYTQALRLVEQMGQDDNMLSAMYGTIGNLYNMLGNEDSTVFYYDRAQAIFEKHGWDESSSILYANLAQFYQEGGELKQASTQALCSLDYAQASGDSLIIAGAHKTLAGIYADMHRFIRSKRHLKPAIAYYSQHKEEESEAHIELLETNAQVEKKLYFRAFILVAALMAVLLVIRRKLYGKKPVQEVLRPAEEEHIQPENCSEYDLTERERQILELIVQGKTNPQIAEQIFLSTETVKWYRKRLLTKFGANNTATLVRIALEKGIIK